MQFDRGAAPGGRKHGICSKGDPLDAWTTPEDAGVQPFDYIAQSVPSSVISDKLMAQINAGKQAIEVTMLYKDIDLSDIIEEVRQKGEAYENSLDSNIYTPDEINEMTGAYKEKLNAELVAAATAARQKKFVILWESQWRTLLLLESPE